MGDRPCTPPPTRPVIAVASPERHAGKMKRWGILGACKLGDMMLEVGMMARGMREKLPASTGLDRIVFTDVDFFTKHMGPLLNEGESLSRSPPFLCWGWRGLLPERGPSGTRFLTKKGHNTFTGVDPLIRHGDMAYAFTPEACEALQPHLEALAGDATAREAHKAKVLATLRVKRTRGPASESASRRRKLDVKTVTE